MAPIQLSQIYPRQQVYYDIIIPIYFIIKRKKREKRKTDVPVIDTPAFEYQGKFLSVNLLLFL